MDVSVMSEKSTENVMSSEICEELTVEDCDELLNFPFHEYTTRNEQREIVKCITTESGISCNSSKYKEDVSEEDSEIEIRDCPEDPRLVESCLSVNLRFQAKLTESINKLQETLQKNQVKKEEFLKFVEDSQKKFNQRERDPYVFCSPYFQGVRRRTAPLNEDAKVRIRNAEITAELNPSRSWTKNEKEKLRKGVYASALKYILNSLNRKIEHLESKLSYFYDEDGDDVIFIDDEGIKEYEKKALKEKILNLKRDIENENTKSEEEIISRAKDHIDWLEVSATHLNGSRDDHECEIMWNNIQSIFINKKPFSSEEDAQLQRLAQEHSERNWDSIAEKLETGRSAFQCFARYQSNFNKSLRQKFWTPEEDAKLVETVETYRVGNFIPWPKVASFLDNRSVDRVLKRYLYVLSKQINRSPYTKEEDAMIMACVNRFGMNWSKAKDFFIGRNTHSLKSRYTWYLNPSMKCGGWTLEEDYKLIELMKKHGFGKWKKIVKEMPGRSHVQCRNRAVHRIMRRYLEEGKFRTNPEKVLHTLKPCKTSQLRKHAEKFKMDIREAASQTLKSALEKIAPTLDETIDLDAMELSSLSYSAFKKLHEELITKLNYNESTVPIWEPEYVNEDLTRVMTNRKRRKELEQGVDIVYESRKERIRSHNIWLENVLKAKFQEQIDIPQGPSFAIGLPQFTSAECSIYEKYLQQQLMCQEVVDDDGGGGDDDDEEEDFKTSIMHLIHHFIQPSLKENHMVVLPPNYTTLSGLDIIKERDSVLRRTADFANHSIPYLRYLIGFIKDVPKCIRCCNAESAEFTKESFKDVVEKVKSRLVIVEEDINKAIKVETRQIQNQPCCCEELANSKNAVNLLTKRFLSLFLWPFLLSTIKPNREQRKYLLRRADSNPHDYKARKEYYLRAKKKRKRDAIDSKKRERDKKIRKLLRKNYESDSYDSDSSLPPLQVNLRSRSKNVSYVDDENSS